MKDYKPQYWVLLEEIDRSRERIKALEDGLMKAIKLIPGAFIPGDEEHYKILKILADAMGKEVVVLPHKEADHD